MNIEVLKKADQANGNFNNGEILEKKPLGFPQDGGNSKPYSNIFYWAHAWTPNKKSTIGLHPHQGFEICSFVLKGSINHFDTKQEKWINLKKGDVQIIRSGNGISHAEEINKESEIFQIWFDPNIRETITKEATYDDYNSDDFLTEEIDGSSIKKIVGNKSVMKMDSEGVNINLYKIPKDKSLKLVLDPEYIYSYFLIKGEIEIDKDVISKGDFFKVSKESNLLISSKEKSNLFEIKSPIRPSYPTYGERYSN